MIHCELTVIGQNTVANTMRTAAAQGQRRVTKATYQWAQQNVVGPLLVKPYPPERPGQRYKRTGALGRGWGVTFNPASVTIHNRMGSSGYVVGDGRGGRQAWMHKGRWWLFRDVVTAARPLLKTMVMGELDHMFALGVIRQ